jgi:hypothetical protein
MATKDQGAIGGTVELAAVGNDGQYADLHHEFTTDRYISLVQIEANQDFAVEADVYVQENNGTDVKFLEEATDGPDEPDATTSYPILVGDIIRRVLAFVGVSKGDQLVIRLRNTASSAATVNVDVSTAGTVDVALSNST